MRKLLDWKINQDIIFSESACKAILYYLNDPGRSMGDDEAGPWESAKDYKIESTDIRINSLGYELYGLAEEEVKVVEG